MSTDKPDKITLEVTRRMKLPNLLDSEAVELVREVVARLQQEAEPVAEVVQAHEYGADGKLTHQRDIDYFQDDIESLPVGTKLYAFPPAQPAQSADHIGDANEMVPEGMAPNAEFCPNCNPCRNSERISTAERLNVEYDAVLRGLASFLGAGGFNDLHRMIDPKLADEKIRWGIDHVIRVEKDRGSAELVAATTEAANEFNAHHEDMLSAVPAGMVLVPKVPTKAMLRPFYECPPDELELAYEAMLVIAAAPARPVGGEGE